MAPHSLDVNIVEQILEDLPPALLALVIPGTLLYLSLYAFAKRWTWGFRMVSVLTLLGFWISESAAPVRCAGLRAQLNFAVAVATMKLLDVHALSLTSSFPSYTSGPVPPPSIMGLILLTELRYESFTPNPIRLPPRLSASNRSLLFSEKFQLLVHITIFLTLQCLPQWPPVKALGVLLTIWIIWTCIQLTLRYPTSPPLFGPIYLADSLASFWTETWHNAFASPCYSLAYTPTFFLLTHLPLLHRNFARKFARSVAVVASFGLMSVFHMYAIAPLLTDEGIRRMGLFFVVNGVLTVAEAIVWDKKKHWLRTIMAWIAELTIASWTVKAFELPDGIWRADWKGLCRPRK